MVDVARLALQIDVTGAQRAKQALQGLQSGSIKATRATDQLVRSNKKIAPASRMSANSLRNVSMQLSQVAQQGAISGNFLQALAIQLPDLALGLGPVGILAGAVAGGLATFAFAADDAAESTDTLRERIEGLELSYRELTSAQKAALRLEFAAEERARQREIEETESRIKSLQSTLEEFRRGTRVRRGPNAASELLVTPEQANAANDSLVKLQGELDTLRDESKSAGDELDNLTNGFDEAQEAIDQANEKVSDLNDSLRFQTQTFGESERAIALAKIEQMAKNGADEEAVRIARQLTNELFDRKDAEQELIDLRKATQIAAADDPLLQRVGAEDRGQSIIEELRKNAEQVQLGLDQELAVRLAHKERVQALDDALRLGVIDSAEERNRLEVESARQRNEQLQQLEMQKFQILNAGQESFLGATEQLFGNLASIAEKGGKDQFNTWKAMASAQAAVSTALAVANALTAAPPPVNFALAASVGALGAVQIAQIQQTEYQGSFLGGGFTGTGSRSGGVDGRGGFPAILHPNETVIDHTQGQAMSGDITVNNYNAPPGTRSEVTRDQRGNVTIDNFLADMASGGPMSRSIQTTYRVRRQGR